MGERTGIIIQARYGSSRLPGKLFLPFYNGQSIIEIFLKNITSFVRGRYDIVLATSDNRKDDLFVSIAKKYDVKLFRGDENDVLKRMTEAAELFKISTVVRVCADNPIYDIQGTLGLLEPHFDQKNDYTAYCLKGGLPSIRSHWGIWGEIVELQALKKVRKYTDERQYHEHVTNYIYGHPDRFRVGLVKADKNIYERKDVRLTVDTVEDFRIMQEIYRQLVENNPEISIKNVLKIIEKNSYYLNYMKEQINKNQK